MLLLEEGEMGFFPTELELICGSLEEVGSFIFKTGTDPRAFVFHIGYTEAGIPPSEMLTIM